MADLTDLRVYADNTADWLLRVARLICEPRGLGKLVTYQQGEIMTWYSRDVSMPEWRIVEDGEVLEAKILI